MTNEQYLALSKLAYVEFGDSDIGSDRTLSDMRDSIKNKFKNDYETNPIIQKILPSLNDWKVVAHQPNTLTGFSATAFQLPPSC